MNPENISRRHLLASAMSLAMGVWLFKPRRANAADLICTDESQLTDAQRKQRLAQHYVDQSPLGAKKNCANCAIFQQGSAAACGSCVLIPGPIHPLGYCDAWTDMM